MNDLLTKDFDFSLPPELIASHPSEQRDSSRMLVIHRKNQSIEHAHFRDLQKYLTPEDTLVLNNTKVVKSRYYSDDKVIELIRVGQESPTLWRCMVRPGKKMKIGKELFINAIRGVVTEIDNNGYRLIQWEQELDADQHGELALPHYMQRSADQSDHERYQTVYAEKEGAIAAPTAGLHFTEKLLSELPHTFLTLHVGVGTFRPIKTERVRDHVMHAEHYELTQNACNKINQAKRVVAVGTTVTRVLEHLAQESPRTHLTPCTGTTNIFLHPPYQPKAVDILLTNFHLPKSTLIMLVSTFAGKSLTMKAYQEAIQEKYKFYSYGDCMLIL